MTGLGGHSLRATGRRALLAACVSVAVWPAAGRAAIEEIEATGRYHLGDNDTKLVGHRLALNEAKRNALEKAGTYVESITEVKDYQLTRDEIRTYSAGILKVEETREPKWKMVRRNLEVTVFVLVRVDTAEVTSKLAALQKDKEATRELKEARAKVEANERKIKQLNQQLKTAKKGTAATEKKQAERTAALDDVDSSTLEAQAAVAKRLSVNAYETTKAYVARQVPAMKGCYRSLTSSGSQAAAPLDTGLAWVGVPPALLLLGKPRRTRERRTR
jgi:hypothetical protein